MQRASIHGRIVMVLAAMLALLWVAPVRAHAQLLDTSPAAATVASEAPETLRLVFNEPVTALAMTLIAPDGSRGDMLAHTVSGETVTVTPPSSLARGTHVLSWRVVSTDGHPIGGTLVFSVGEATGSGAADLPATDRLVATGLWLAKAALLAGLLFGVGGAVFGIATPLTGAARSVAQVFAGIGIVAAPLSLGLHGLDALGMPLADLVSSAPWLAGWSTSFGPTVLACASALAAALVALSGARFTWLGWPAWLIGGVALALSGHAGSAEPQWLTRPAVALHVGGLLFWVGALPGLAILLRSRGEGADFGLVRFSKSVPLAVAAILVSGLVLAAIQMGPPGPHWLTAYAAILALKLALVAMLLALALWNRLRLTRPALAGEIAARHRLRQSIRAEIGLVLLILALVAGWRFTPPPRALADVAAAASIAAEPAYAHAMNDELMADLTITPGRAGPVAIDILLMDAAGAAVAPQGVTLTLAAPGLGIEPLRYEAVADADGVWQVAAATIPLPGAWTFSLDIRMSRFSLVRLATDIVFP